MGEEEGGAQSNTIEHVQEKSMKKRSNSCCQQDKECMIIIVEGEGRAGDCQIQNRQNLRHVLKIEHTYVVSQSTTL